MANEREPAKHVLLLSVDGLHQSDLAFYVQHHPGSALAKLVGGRVEFTHAQAPVPTDSFPGLIAQVTGGNPSSTGTYYDDTFKHALLRAGTTKCAGVAPGVEVTYFEQLDEDPLALDAGEGLARLPGSILQMTGNPETPGPLLTRAPDYVNTKVGAMIEAIQDRHLEKSTAIILSAEHGQSPQTPSALTRIRDGPIIDALNTAWKAAHPAPTTDLVAFSVNDDGMLIWLSDRVN